MDDLDDMFDSIINKPTKPQPKKAEASSLEPEEKKDEVTKTENTEDEVPPLRYRRIRKVPYLKKWPKCGLCSTVLLGNRFGWFAEDEDGEHWWWCVPCMEKCNCYATEEEIERASKERKSRAK